MLIMLFNLLLNVMASLKSGPSKGGYWVCCDCLASMVVFDKSSCTVLYLFKMFNSGSGVWIPYRRGVKVCDTAGPFYQTSLASDRK